MQPKPIEHVSLHNIRAKCLEGISILRNEGLLSFIRAGLRELNLNHRGFYYYLNYLYKRSRRSYRTAEPFTVVNVDPQRIRYRAPSDIDRWKHIGEVRDGDWDCSSRPLEDGCAYRSVVDRFEHGTSWKETDIYQATLERIENGETHWNGCRTVDDLERRIDHVERLYETIRESGFKSQSEIHDRSVRSMLLSGSFDRSKTDIAVAIGRDGEILFVDGNHRLAIARILGLDRIPVRITARHTEWQRIRELVTNTPRSELPPDIQSHLDHPDLKGVLKQKS